MNSELPSAVEVLVIGAGPAGATGARVLAENGKDTLLLEARSLPRWKPCGGGIPKRTLDALGFAIDEVALGRMRSFALDGAWGGRISVDVENPNENAATVVERSAFDLLLTKKAEAAGAKLIEDCRAGKITAGNGGFTIETVKGDVKAGTILFADGVFSPGSRQLGFEKNRLGFCLEGLLPISNDADAAEKSRAIFHLTCIRDGYAWAFPRGEYFAVGIGTSREKDFGLRLLLDKFIAATPELKDRKLQSLHGGMLPVFSPRPYYAANKAYVAGDAAGLVDPLSGEGIYYAVESGRLAAEAILDGGEVRYEEMLQQKILRELIYAKRFARRFHFVPTWLRKPVLGLPKYRKYAAMFADLLSGKISYPEIYEQMHQ